MKPKILFWIDASQIHFCIAKYIQDNLDCEMYSIFEITEKPKQFYENQSLVNFKKNWFYHDHILKSRRKPDLNYLKTIEEKYNIPLWLIASNDRFFNHFNEFYRFSYDEILLILEDEIKLFEMILDEVNPNYMIMHETHQQQNHIFYEICKARKIKILMTTTTRSSIKKKNNQTVKNDAKKRSKYSSAVLSNLSDVTTEFTTQSDKFHITDELDKFEPLPDNIKSNIYEKIDLEKKFDNNPNLDSMSEERLTSNSKYFSAFLKFLFTNDTNVQTHFTYFGRSKLKVLFKVIFFELRKKYRERFMSENLSVDINDDLPFVYFPLHQEIERILLIGAPFYTNQLEQIKSVAQSLPIGYKLYVKDHPSMRIRGWRGVSEMKKIMKLQNIKLMHPLVNSDEIIKKSDLVVSIRGTSAVDAAFHGKPSIIFGNVGMFQLSFIHKLKSIEELPQAIRNSLKKIVDPKEFKKYLDAVNSESFESEFQSLISAYEQIFHKGGYYVNVEIESDKLDSFLKKYKNEFTKLALYHIAKMKELN